MKSLSHNLGSVGKALFLGIWMIITLFPLYWILISSFKGPAEIFSWPLTYWPREFDLSNYKGLFQISHFQDYMLNSLIVALVAGVLSTCIAVLSAYVISRFKFRGSAAVMMAFLATQMVPAFIALSALYQMMVKLKLSDSLIGLALVYIAMCIPFSTVMLRGFFMNIPDTLDEAAMIDGCTRLQTLWRVVVPVMRPGIVAAFIFNFVNCWNELFLAVTLLNRDSVKTVPPALNGFITGYNIQWGPISAAAVVTILPTMVLFAFASKHIVAGLTAGAVKG